MNWKGDLVFNITDITKQRNLIIKFCEIRQK